STNPNEAYTYDPVGNRNPLTQTYDAGNRLLDDSTYTYTYDHDGNMTSKTHKTTLETTTYTYNSEDQLIGVTTPPQTVSYRYDAIGRRIEKNVSGTIIRYVYDGEDIIQELDQNNQIVATYTHGPGIDEPILVEKNGQKYYYIADDLGSITALVDQSGNIAQTYRYDSFGNILNQTGTLDQPFTYTGREYDSETGLYYYRARYYDAKIGRFLQEDPIWSKNLYSYCANNPLNYVDPFGLKLIFKGWYSERNAIDWTLYAIAKDDCTGDVFLYYAGYENNIINSKTPNYSNDVSKNIINLVSDYIKMGQQAYKYGDKTKLEFLISSPKINGQKIIDSISSKEPAVLGSGLNY
ncbi:MAG: hypothetical protein PHH44_00005, partial [bacterium]|nr:hypothetical protein [bacterium]